MTRKVMLAPLLGLMLGALACGSDKELSMPSGGGQALTPLVGTWLGTCTAGGLNAQSNRLSWAVGADGKVTRDRTFFSAADCPAESVAYTLSEAMSFVIIRKVSATEEKYDVNYESRGLTVTANQATVDLWNEQIFCESVAWEADKPLDRTDKDCHDTQLVFDLIKIDGTALFFGEKTGDYSGRSNDERPLLVSATGFSKQ